jgi:hypothetical protein
MLAIERGKEREGRETMGERGNSKEERGGKAHLDFTVSHDGTNGRTISLTLGFLAEVVRGVDEGEGFVRSRKF